MGRYKWDKTNHVLIPISNETSNFTGTAAEWNALVAAEKAKYKTVDLTDDFNGVEVIDNLSRTTYSGEPLSARMGNSLGKMVANIESTSTASQLYKVNDQFVYNGILYKVTSQIASGGAITPGSNCTPAPSVTSQISNLSSLIGPAQYLPYNGKVRFYDLEYDSSLASKEAILAYLNLCSINEGIEMVSFHRPSSTYVGFMITQFSSARINHSGGYGVGMFIGYYYETTIVYFTCKNGTFTLKNVSLI